MTREEACKKAQIIDFQGGYTIALVAEIFNDHETAIEILMKANEEEISRHFNECEKYEAQLKAKDEEIERLKADINKMKCCENCEFEPNFECSFNTQYGCLDDVVPSNWKVKGNKNV